MRGWGGEKKRDGRERKRQLRKLPFTQYEGDYVDFLWLSRPNANSKADKALQVSSINTVTLLFLVD